MIAAAGTVAATLPISAAASAITTPASLTLSASGFASDAASYSSSLPSSTSSEYAATPPPKLGLSTGAKIGTGIGVSLVALATLAMFILLRRYRFSLTPRGIGEVPAERVEHRHTEKPELEAIDVLRHEMDAKQRLDELCMLKVHHEIDGRQLERPLVELGLSATDPP